MATYGALIVATILVALRGTEGAADTYDNTVHGGRYPPGSDGSPNPPPFPTFPHFDYNRLFGEYFQQLQAYHQQLIEYPNRGSYSVGASGMFFDDKPHEVRAEVNIGSATRRGYEQGASNGYGASAGVNYDGNVVRHHVYPNAETPNVKIENRFADPSPVGAQRYGVFVSSAGGSGVGTDGKTYKYKTATSAIDNNGNITTYTVHEP